MWRDRRVIVTGGTAGFGLVLARRLAQDGARVLIVGRSPDGVRRALEACDRAGEATSALHGITADLGRAGEGNRVAGESLRLLGGIDDVFCCVGRSGRAKILDAGDDLLREYLTANLFAATELTRAVADDVAAAIQIVHAKLAVVVEGELADDGGNHDLIGFDIDLIEQALDDFEAGGRALDDD